MFQSYLIVALPKQGFEVAASIMDKAVYSTAMAKLEKKGLLIRRAILKKKSRIWATLGPLVHV